MSIDKKAFGLSDSLVSAVNEALKGGQKKLDKNHNGKLDADDFKKLRGEDKDKEQAVANEQSPGDYEKANFKHSMLGTDKQMKNEAVSDAAKKVLGAVAKKHGGKVPFTSTTYKDGKKIVTRGHNDEKGNRVVTSVKNEEVEIDEAAAVGAPMPNMAATMDARKSEVQRKIAQKQAAFQKSKANKRIAGTVKEGGKCSCGDTNESKMKCEVHGGPKNRQMTKGGKEPVVMNPPLKEASDLPKKVVTKGHEIAKSLIKHRAKVKSPYAVGMATAKKSAGIKD